MTVFLEHLHVVPAGELSALTGLQNMFGVGAGSILLPPVQTSALGMPLLQGPDGAINLINNIQVVLKTFRLVYQDLSYE